MPKVSVIIPTYNRGNFIVAAIESVLAQNYRDFEIIVVDDGSTDNTQLQLKPFKEKLNNGRIRYFYQPNQGIACARNTGIRCSQGEYIAFLDSDDLWLGDKLKIQTEILDGNPAIGLTYASMIIYDEKGNYRGLKPSKVSGTNFQELIEWGGHYPTSTIMLRKDCFKRVGLFDENFARLEDFDMWLRISRLYRIFPVIDQPLGIYRWHDNNSIFDEQIVYESQIKLYQKIFNQFPDAPAKVVKQKLAKNQYLLSKFHFKERNYVKASQHLQQALINNPHVGKGFWKKDDRWDKKITKSLKPYTFIALCWGKRIFSDSSNKEKEHLHICLLNHSFHKQIGGIETYTCRMAKAFAKRGHTVRYKNS